MNIRYYLENYKLGDHATPILMKRKRAKIEEKRKYNLSSNSAWYFYNPYNKQYSFSKDEIRDENAEKNGFVVCNSRYVDVRQVVEYIEEIDSIAVLTFILPTDPSCFSKVKDWEYKGGFVINKDKKCSVLTSRITWCYSELYKDSPNYGRILTEWTYFENVSFSKVPTFYRFYGATDRFSEVGINGESFETLVKPFVKMFNRTCNIGSNIMVDITENPKNLAKFLSYKEPVGRSGPKQKKIDELIGKDLPEVKISSALHEKIGILQRVEENLCVLRTYYGHDSEFIEGGRIYFDNKNAYACKKINDGSYKYLVLKTSCKNWEFYLEDFDKNIAKGTILEYYSSIIETITPNLRSLYMWCFSAYPIFEKLYKNGFTKTVNFILENNDGRNPINILQSIFGKVSSGKTLAAQIGVNKRQLQFVQSYFEDSFIGPDKNRYTIECNAFRMMKVIFDDTYLPRYMFGKMVPSASLASLDNESFDTLFENTRVIIANTSWQYHVEQAMCALRKIMQNYDLATSVKVSENLIKMLVAPKTTIPNVTKINNFIDFVNMLIEVRDIHRFRPFFENEEDLSSKHDQLVELINMKKNEILSNAFDKRKEFWDKMVFDDGKSEFVVVRPDIPDDLAREGMELRHCVKSYIKRVAEGYTNIMFIRKRNDVDTPFFTVEVTNDMTIQQIHGSCNRNIDTEPGMESFVKTWCKKCKLSTSNFNKVR